LFLFSLIRRREREERREERREEGREGGLEGGKGRSLFHSKKRGREVEGEGGREERCLSYLKHLGAAEEQIFLLPFRGGVEGGGVGGREAGFHDRSGLARQHGLRGRREGGKEGGDMSGNR